MAEAKRVHRHPACSVCGKNLFQAALYRENEFGVEPEWRCRKHVTAYVNKEVEDLTETIGGQK